MPPKMAAQDEKRAHKIKMCRTKPMQRQQSQETSASDTWAKGAPTYITYYTTAWRFWQGLGLFQLLGRRAAAEFTIDFLVEL